MPSAVPTRDPAARPSRTTTTGAGAIRGGATSAAEATARRAVRRRRLWWTALALLSSCEARAEAPPPATCEREVAAAAKRYDIPLAVFYAVGLNETGVRGRLQPFAMNVDGRGVLAASLGEATAGFHKAKAAGARMIDIGCMQINHHYHAARFGSLEAMFDPAQNVDYAARFLRELKEREHSWTMAVARYNAGPNNDPAQKVYVCGVLRKMVASGFGAWTESAKKFCFAAGVVKSSPASPTPASEPENAPHG